MNLTGIILTTLLTMSFLSVIFLFSVWPGKAEWPEWMIGCRFAHRGLHTRDQTVPENSMDAFRKAISRQVGIELDVRMTLDDEVVVFHDPELIRMCGCPDRVSELSYGELSKFRLAGTDCLIPLLSDVLPLIDGQVPLLVELKSSRKNKGLCARTTALLDTYRGPYCIQSFDPRIVHWFRRHRPDVFRGQLAAKGGDKKGLARLRFVILRHLVVNFIGRPNFISYRLENAGNPAFRICRRAGAAMLGWVVRDPAVLIDAEIQFDAVVFEAWDGMFTDHSNL